MAAGGHFEKNKRLSLKRLIRFNLCIYRDHILPSDTIGLMTVDAYDRRLDPYFLREDNQPILYIKRKNEKADLEK